MEEICLSCLATFCLLSVVVSSGDGGGDSSVGQVLGGDGLALGGGDLVVHGLAGDLGDGVAVLDLDRDVLDNGVINAVLGDDGPAGVLHGGLDGVSDGVGNRGDNGGSGVAGIASIGKVLGISLGLGLSLGEVVSSGSDGDSRLVADHVLDLLADLLVLNLLGVDGDGVADVLGGGSAHLGGQDLHHGLAVGGGDGSSHGGGSVGGGGGSQEVLGVSLGISSGLGAGEGEQSRNGNNLDYGDFRFGHFKNKNSINIKF